MKLYFAPLEGITGYILRSTYHAHFESADKYFIPFLNITSTFLILLEIMQPLFIKQ